MYFCIFVFLHTKANTSIHHILALAGGCVFCCLYRQSVLAILYMYTCSIANTDCLYKQQNTQPPARARICISLCICKKTKIQKYNMYR